MKPMDDSQLFDRAELDEIFAILSDRVRRDVLRNLAANGDSLPVEALTEQCLDGRDEGYDESSLRVQLHHLHLPKMADSDLLEYHTDPGLAVLTERGQQAERVRQQSVELMARSAR